MRYRKIKDNVNLNELKRNMGRATNMALEEYDNGNYKAVVKLLENTPNGWSSPAVYYLLSKAYYKLKKYDKAKRNLGKLIDLVPEHFAGLYMLAKIHLKEDKLEEAEECFKKAIKADNKNGNIARVELGKLCIKQGKLDEAEKVLKEAIRKNENEVHARFELIKVCIAKKQDKEYKEIYDYLTKNMLVEAYDEERAHKEIQSHWEDDLTKNKFGVFTVSYDKIKEAMATSTLNRKRIYMYDLYCFKLENCGYQGGKKGDNHQFDYVTIMTAPFTSDIVRMFPSDNMIIDNEKEKDEQDAFCRFSEE